MVAKVILVPIFIVTIHIIIMALKINKILLIVIQELHFFVSFTHVGSRSPARAPIILLNSVKGFLNFRLHDMALMLHLKMTEIRTLMIINYPLGN